MKKILFYTFIIGILAAGCSSYGTLAEADFDDGSSTSTVDKDEPNGLITAGEWNDLENWDFWKGILNQEAFANFPTHWDIFTQQRIAVKVLNTSAQPAINVKVELQKNNNTVWTAMTDNKGTAELWASPFELSAGENLNDYKLLVNNGEQVITSLKWFEDGVHDVTISNLPAVQNQAEIAFVVDATGSMSDELEFLKNELTDVIQRVVTNNGGVKVRTSAVFYRDKGDRYVTRVSDFTNDMSVTQNFINAQSADGGGDFPEAVHSAMDKAVNDLKWENASKAKIIFLLLDAPPHHKDGVLEDLEDYIKKSAENGIKVIPITASGIDKETEFLMRFYSVLTNGTYVFITNHSGIGDHHIEPSIGSYEVEYLNDLMVRLINEYLE